MLDKSIPYIDILMRKKPSSPILNILLPDGYRFCLFKKGDEKDWAEIETSVMEFDRSVDALIYFQETYLPYLKELERRCIFVENRNGEKIGTSTAWWGYTNNRRDPWMHWVAVKPEYQSLGIGKALISKILKLMLEIEGDRDFYLHTQTWSYKAIKIYEKAGFFITDEKGLDNYGNEKYKEAISLLKTLNSTK